VKISHKVVVSVVVKHKVAKEEKHQKEITKVWQRLQAGVVVAVPETGILNVQKLEL